MRRLTAPVAGVLLILWASPHSLRAQVEPTPATSDSAPRLARFPKDLVLNAAAIFSSDNIVPLFVGTAATFASRPADDSIRNFFQNEQHWKGFDGVGRQIGKSQLVGPAIGVALLTGAAIKNPELQSLSYDLAQGFVLTNAMTAGIKTVSGRSRPDVTSDYSFPSGHTSNSFMWATVLARHWGWVAGVPAYAVASYVGASRLESEKHFLTDVVAGATLGYIVGRTVTRKRKRGGRINLGVAIPPGGGAAATLAIRVD
jgi:membrane-associated phospholipid phosphatase